MTNTMLMLMLGWEMLRFHAAGHRSVRRHHSTQLQAAESKEKQKNG